VLRHVVVFRWKPGTTAAQIDAISEALGALPGQIAELRDYRFGRDAGLAEGNAEFAVVADCDDADGWRAYIDHPAHQRVVHELVAPVVESRTAVQFELTAD
jgi:hypothetical protein